MKPIYQKLSVALTAVLFAACGNANNPVVTNPQTVNGAQTGLNGAQGGCVPIQSALSFTGQGVGMNGAVILAGNLPSNSTHPGAYGQVVMGSGFSQTGGQIQYQPKQSQNGSLQLYASQVGGQGGTISGMLQLNQAIVQQIMALASGYNYNYSNTGAVQQPNSVCVSSIALDIVHTVASSTFNPSYYTGGMYPQQQSYPQQQMGGVGYINQALVYLYINGSQPIGPIAF